MVTLEKQLAPALVDQLGQILGLRRARERSLRAASPFGVQDRQRSGEVARANLRLGNYELRFLIRCERYRRIDSRVLRLEEMADTGCARRRR
jgi:hypothetical protein